MKNQSDLNLKPSQFQRRFGIKIQTLKAMVNALKNFKSENQKDRRGRRTIRRSRRTGLRILGILERISNIFSYWDKLGSIWINYLPNCNWYRINFNENGKVPYSGEKGITQRLWLSWIRGDGCHRNSDWATKKKQKIYYSGQKKCQTLKTQLVINQETKEIICTAFGPGHCHDFNLFKKSKTNFHPETNSWQDSGYQGIKNYHTNSYIPRKKPKNGKLSRIEKDYNRVLAQERIVIEHVNRSLKIFKILSSRYRNRRRRYGLRCNLLSAIYNYELALGD